MKLSTPLGLIAILIGVFSIGPAAHAASPAPVQLGAGVDYVVLTESTITSTGETRIFGNTGLNSGSAITGFPPGNVSGMEELGSTAVANATANLHTAFDDLVNRTTGSIMIPGEMGGRTLTPGLYTTGNELLISRGDLILDAQGNSNAVFIFKINTTLDLATARHVLLTNGTKSCNVFWQVNNEATIENDAVMQGTILADGSITMMSGSRLNGRIFSRNGSIMLDNSVLVGPTCSGGSSATPLPGDMPAGFFARNMGLGMVGADVKELQLFLNREGFRLSATGAGSPGNETTYFGVRTRAALIKFQEAHRDEILTPLSLNNGTGFFGNNSRAAANLLR